MSEIKFIVDRLNADPFNKGLSLVAFDECSPFELIEILNGVFVHMDPAHDVGLREEPPDARANRFMNFLQLLNFHFPDPNNLDAFRDGLMNGDRNTVYPVLYWALSRLPQLSKRAYLARFLVRVEVPPEYLQDPAMDDTYRTYQELQREFKETHKMLDQLRQSPLQPGQLRREIQTLEDEKSQLADKLSHLRQRMEGQRGFQELLEATSGLRQEQEQEAKLGDRENDQRHQLHLAGVRQEDAMRRLQEMRSAVSRDVTAEGLFRRLQDEVAALTRQLTRDLPRQHEESAKRLEQLEQQKQGPVRSAQDVEELRDEEDALTRAIDRANSRIQEVTSKAGNEQLTIYRQHASVIAGKLAAKEEEVDAAETEGQQLAREVEAKEASISDSSGPKFMSREEFKQYKINLRSKIARHKQLKGEMAAIRAESVVLSRTEQILKGRDDRLDELLQRLEKQRGVAGYSGVQQQIEHVSEANQALNETKGKTLEEISKIVTDINQALKERKNKLAPQIKELRAVRQSYQEMEAEYLENKGVYENTAVGLETERIKLENECKQYQDDCLREESRYHFLNCLISIADAKLERVQEEAKYERDEARLLRDFKTYKELYQHKVQMQERLSKELRAKQRDIRENEGENMQQRQMFSSLRELLQCKARLLRNRSGQQQDQLSVSQQYDTMDIDGAKVMTLDN